MSHMLIYVRYGSKRSDGADVHVARKKGSFLPRGMTAVFAVAEAPVSVDTLVIPASFVPRVIVGRVRCRAS